MMKQSNIRFTSPFIKRIFYEINNEFQENDQPLNVDNSFNVRVSKDGEDNLAIVELDITLGNEELKDNVPFYINMTVGAMFSWDNVYDNETVQVLLSVNAPSLLLGYARPIVSTITSMSPYPSYNIPFYNFTE